MTPSYEALDEALELLRPYGPELGNGNFNHAPMVAEALCVVGRPQAVLPWIERYRPRLAPRGAAGDPVAAECWRDELGRRDRFPAWSAFFAAALADAPWADVLGLWAARLAPGVSAAATHGAIRVGHAVRSLSERETPQRRRELADALASWAASYGELPAYAGTGERRLPPREAIARVAVVPREQRRPGSISAGLARLAEFPEFAPAIGLANLDGDIGLRVSKLCELFARVSLANISNIPTAICFIHGVTSLAALGHITPHVEAATARALLRFGWQAGCGLYACFGGGVPYAIEVDSRDEGAAVLVERAVANGDEHAIKFTEACLSRHQLAPSPAFPAAVAHALKVIEAR